MSDTKMSDEMRPLALPFGIIDKDGKLVRWDEGSDSGPMLFDDDEACEAKAILLSGSLIGLAVIPHSWLANHAAAIGERDELVEMIAELLRDDPSDEWIDHSGLIEKWRKATDLLVKHGRIVMVDGAYKWSDRR